MNEAASPSSCQESHFPDVQRHERGFPDISPGTAATSASEELS
jgi:hypothetical protein